ncbi:hypothetical protein ECG_07847 [Echinococcus granulosus]|uniref:Uncharacterized protein n=1 Tax=Echinococcus granulosus TaxID=6210 RepID=A0A068WR51_ECHGR|nr:hypothetical protein ECG_07847 [Echinococcus granulosus]CDS22263.1 hypothetical protein EgrG_002026700 [Echinococcus granulosus]
MHTSEEVAAHKPKAAIQSDHQSRIGWRLHHLRNLAPESGVSCVIPSLSRGLTNHHLRRREQNLVSLPSTSLLPPIVIKSSEIVLDGAAIDTEHDEKCQRVSSSSSSPSQSQKTQLPMPRTHPLVTSRRDLRIPTKTTALDSLGLRHWIICLANPPWSRRLSASYERGPGPEPDYYLSLGGVSKHLSVVIAMNDVNGGADGGGDGETNELGGECRGSYRMRCTPHSLRILSALTPLTVKQTLPPSFAKATKFLLHSGATQPPIISEFISRLLLNHPPHHLSQLACVNSATMVNEAELLVRLATGS